VQLILYTGQGCGLCEQAEALLKAANKELFSQLKRVDVRTDTQLYHLYGARIPVLYKGQDQTELPWPFDSLQLVEFLR
jgi:hypothetical protein